MYIATVYRTVKSFEEASILERHDFGDGRARYEERPESHHDHLIDVKTGEVVEFSNEEIERLQAEVARTLGYRLVDHRLELFGVRLDSKRNDSQRNDSKRPDGEESEGTARGCRRPRVGGPLARGSEERRGGKEGI